MHQITHYNDEKKGIHHFPLTQHKNSAPSVNSTWEYHFTGCTENGNHFKFWYFAHCASQCIYLNINHLDALNFIMSLFHASTCFEQSVQCQEAKIVQYSLWYHHTYRWPPRAQIERGLDGMHSIQSSLNMLNLSQTICKGGQFLHFTLLENLIWLNKIQMFSGDTQCLPSQSQLKF